jgi:hypothetical protein
MTSKVRAQESKIGTVAQALAYSAVTWAVLDATRLYIGREAEWVCGTAILAFVIVAFFRRKKIRN